MFNDHLYRRCCWWFRSILTVPLLLGSILITIGCGDSEIEEHHVPKGVERIARPSPVDRNPVTDPGQNDPSGDVRPVTDLEPWDVPDRWRRVPGQRPMRVATFEIPLEHETVEVAVTRFPGDVGGVLANVNRWRGQMGLPAIGEGDLPAVVTRFASSGFDGYAIRVRGQTQHMLAAGVYEASKDRTWFVRVTTRPELADQVEGEVFGFARSIAGLATQELP